ncbi:L domain-like protein, partial [Meira miltonrushii]
MLRKSGTENGGASFLTNASFNGAHDKVLQLLTDVAPWDTRWHSMLKIDLRGRRADTLLRLNEFLPKLSEALLDDNEIEYLTGLPSTLRYLSISRNRLPSTAAFGHLENLETLDVSENNIDLRALRTLHQLKHLRANSNRITTIEGIQDLEKLETLHLRGNGLDELEIQPGQWPCLRDLVLSHNRLSEVVGLGNLARLRSLNLDHNRLQDLDLGFTMPKLKQLRVSGNKYLSSLDVGPARNLRTLYADECSLKEVLNIGTLTKLDNLSLRQQNGDGELQWPVHDTRDVKRLFLSGNAFPAVAIITPFFGLVYLELSGCQLTSLPGDLAMMVPNLRQLNADYNPLESLPPMNKMSRLKRFSLIGCRIDRSSKLIESLEGCEELNLLDFRMNPCTLGLYPPII